MNFKNNILLTTSYHTRQNHSDVVQDFAQNYTCGTNVVKVQNLQLKRFSRL